MFIAVVWNITSYEVYTLITVLHRFHIFQVGKKDFINYTDKFLEKD